MTKLFPVQENIQMDERGYVNSSGFPLQIGLRKTIEETKLSHGWNVVAEEYPWEHHNYSNSGFIDLILDHDFERMIIECKRVRDAKWIFLKPEAKRHRTYSRFCKTNNDFFFWTEGNVEPSSYEAAFCVVPGQDPKSKPMLERTASELILATEAVAVAEREMGKQSNFYFPVIVTTAELRICIFSPEEISLEKGEIANAAFETVPFLRFRKSFIPWSGRAESLAESSRESERTVFIVNSLGFIDFLRAWERTSA